MGSEIYTSLAILSVIKHENPHWGKQRAIYPSCPALGMAVKWEWWDCQLNKTWCCRISAVPPTPVHATNTKLAWPWQGITCFTLLWFHSKVCLHIVILAQHWIYEGSPGAVILLPALPFPSSLPSVTGHPRHTEVAELQLCSPSVLRIRGCTQALLGSTAEQIIYSSVFSLCWKW